MNDEDFMNELEELTKTMTKEFSQEKSSQSNKDNIQNNRGNSSNSGNLPKDFNFGMDFEGNDMNYMKEIEKLLQMGMGIDFKVEDNDPQTKEMMNLLSKILC